MSLCKPIDKVLATRKDTNRFLSQSVVTRSLGRDWMGSGKLVTVKRSLVINKGAV